MLDKHYWSVYYGIEETLPDDEFYRRVKEINKECEEKARQYERKIGKTN